MATEIKWHITCPPGLEPMLHEELVRLGASSPKRAIGVVSGEDPIELVSQLAFESAVGSRLLVEIKSFSARNQEMLYDQVRRIKWKDYILPSQTIAVFSEGAPEMARNLASLKIKDAICDELRKQGQDRPNVDRKNPDLRIHAHFNQGKVVLSFDALGYPLYERGGPRSHLGDGLPAPLKENRAAAFVRWSGWTAETPLVDAFCGSGTVLVEAALWACNISPGFFRKPEFMYAWKTLPAWRAPLEKAAKHAKRRHDIPKNLKISGSDTSTRALKAAEQMLSGWGLSSMVSLELCDARKRVSDKGSLWLSNPPHGNRISDVQSAATLISEFTRHAKFELAPCTIGLLLPEGKLESSVGFRPSKKLRFVNGGVESKFLLFDVKAGKFRS